VGQVDCQLNLGNGDVARQLVPVTPLRGARDQGEAHDASTSSISSRETARREKQLQTAVGRTSSSSSIWFTGHKFYAFSADAQQRHRDNTRSAATTTTTMHPNFIHPQAVF
jgi:hypothetical protein